MKLTFDYTCTLCGKDYTREFTRNDVILNRHKNLRYCPECQESKPNYRGGTSKEIKQKANNQDVKIYRPGDPGFEDIAREITPILDIPRKESGENFKDLPNSK